METITPLVPTGMIAERSTLAGWVVATIPPWSRAVAGAGSIVSVSPPPPGTNDSFSGVTAPLAIFSVITAFAAILSDSTAPAAISALVKGGVSGLLGTENDSFSGVTAPLAISLVPTALAAISDEPTALAAILAPVIVLDAILAPVIESSLILSRVTELFCNLASLTDASAISTVATGGVKGRPNTPSLILSLVMVPSAILMPVIAPSIILAVDMDRSASLSMVTCFSPMCSVLIEPSFIFSGVTASDASLDSVTA